MLAPVKELIDPDLFSRYIDEFPCLKDSGLSYDNLIQWRLALIHNSNEDEQFPVKELALDCVLELLSGGDYEITWKDIFDIFPSSDRAAFIKIMQCHIAD